MNPYQSPAAPVGDAAGTASASQGYMALWKRGWWFWLLMLCFNIGLGVLFVPLAMLTAQRPTLYFVLAVAIGLILGPLYGGWLYNKFASSTHGPARPPAGNADA